MHTTSTHTNTPPRLSREGHETYPPHPLRNLRHKGRVGKLIRDLNILEQYTVTRARGHSEPNTCLIPQRSLSSPADQSPLAGRCLWETFNLDAPAGKEPVWGRGTRCVTPTPVHPLAGERPVGALARILSRA